MSHLYEVMQNSKYKNGIQDILGNIRREYNNMLTQNFKDHPPASVVLEPIPNDRLLLRIDAGVSSTAICLEHDYAPIYRFFEVSESWHINFSNAAVSHRGLDNLTVGHRFRFSGNIIFNVNNLNEILISLHSTKRYGEIDQSLNLKQNEDK